MGETKRAGFQDGREFWRGTAWESSVREEWLKEMHNLLEKEKKKGNVQVQKKKSVSKYMVRMGTSPSGRGLRPGKVESWGDGSRTSF